ncbi:RNA-guided endonuclease InsQ/TnpB family protein [Rhodococcus sp. IEGM 1366]|uniref:RNA-guided endonuclease InsQ/TnpB family protein n=1 Tax=Rhodococcus sp. IEGM 1366 TaxID=3082223 RepID=UPI00398940E2
MSLTTPPPPRRQPCTTRVVGIDRGVANSIATSEGRMLHTPGFRAGEQVRFVALQRRLSRQQKGSANRHRTKAKLGWLRLSDRRGDWIEKTTTDIADTYAAAAVENLPIRNMTRRATPKPDPDNPGAFPPNGGRAKSGLNRAILASCWGKFAHCLDQKISVIAMSAAYTSQECSNCGHSCPENHDSQAFFRCQGCGFERHADTNAGSTFVIVGFISNINPRAFRGIGCISHSKRAAPTVSVA